MTVGRIAVVAALGLTLAGCGDSHEELRDWMEKQKAATPLLKDKLQEPKSFKAFRYDGSAAPDPFSPGKIRLVADQPVEASRNTGPRPDTSRRREPLESFPLDIIRMVGHVTSAGQTFALLQVESVVYQVKAGNYVGPNHGRIVKVTENEVTLREIVQDGAGDWAERENSLRLTEGSK